MIRFTPKDTLIILFDKLESMHNIVDYGYCVSD